MTYNIKMKRLLLLLIPLTMQSQVDNQKHFIAGASISGLTYASTYAITKNKNKATIYSLLASTGAGVLKELHDIKTTGFDSKDLLYTSLGGASVTITINLFDKKH